MDPPSPLITALEETHLVEATKVSAPATDQAENYILRVERRPGLVMVYTLIDQRGSEVWHWPPDNEPSSRHSRAVANDNQGNFLDIDV